LKKKENEKFEKTVLENSGSGVAAYCNYLTLCWILRRASASYCCCCRPTLNFGLMTPEDILSIACLREGLKLRMRTYLSEGTGDMFRVEYIIAGTGKMAFAESRRFQDAKDQAIIMLLQQLLCNDDAKKKQSNV